MVKTRNYNVPKEEHKTKDLNLNEDYHLDVALSVMSGMVGVAHRDSLTAKTPEDIEIYENEMSHYLKQINSLYLWDKSIQNIIDEINNIYAPYLRYLNRL